MITARSTPNIALIKFWGYPEGELYTNLRLCAADSLSMTLNEPYVDVTVDHANELTVASVTLGQPKEMNEKSIKRYAVQLNYIKEYLAQLGCPDAIPAEVSISIDSHIPPSIGLASSAAVFSAVAKAVAGLVQEKIELTDEQLSVMARLGSGSAARSIFGGFGAIRVEGGTSIDSAVGWQVADENHWKLHDIVIIPKQEEKKVGSSEGHPLANTSPHFAKRIEDIQTRRQPECIDAILNKDFEKLQQVSEEDCMDMHEQIMQQQTPPLNYLSTETYRIVDEVKKLRTEKHLPVLYTMDAGFTVHLFCEDEALDTIRSYAHAQENCEVYESAIGSGSSII